MAFFSTILAEGVLQTRIYALYGQNKGVLTLMVACYAIATAISAWAAITDIIQAKSAVISVPRHVLCSFPTLSKNTFGLWLPPLIFESGLCIMALYKGIQTLSYVGGRRRRVSLMDILIRDSVLYFLIISVLYTTCFVMWMAAPVAYLEIPVGILVAMTCILGSRMIFNLRVAGVKQHTFAPENGVPLVVLERV
ncbi:hypothetical protein D9613_008234 [Agrocybe pediades]|uniref:Uncharacterized protein n=1 Tax=Agrocybe pediades TaxID=84607 RepID=A0A8H4VNU2_9AGAR|nr:hypothetical protein D9613_008234 [Agrocybe pediades]